MHSYLNRRGRFSVQLNIIDGVGKSIIIAKRILTAFRKASGERDSKAEILSALKRAKKRQGMMVSTH